MLHFTINPTVKLPADVALFDGLTPRPGEQANLSCSVICLETGNLLDFTDGTFKASPTTPTMPVTPMQGMAYDYVALLSPGNYKRGHYRALFRQSVTGEEFSLDFSVGVHTNRKLGYTAAYDGTTLVISVWIEENGEAQTDYVSLTQPRLLNATGNVVAGGNWADNTNPVNGVFTFSNAMTLNTASVYIFSCTANVPGPSGNYSFPLRFGITRP